MQMKCQLTQHKSGHDIRMGQGGVWISVESGLETDQACLWTGRLGVIIALVPRNVCEQMIYNICHEMKLNFAFALTPFMAGCVQSSGAAELQGQRFKLRDVAALGLGRE